MRITGGYGRACRGIGVRFVRPFVLEQYLGDLGWAFAFETANDPHGEPYQSFGFHERRGKFPDAFGTVADTRIGFGAGLLAQFLGKPPGTIAGIEDAELDEDGVVGGMPPDKILPSGF